MTFTARMKPYRPDKVFIEKAAQDSADVGRILSRLPGVPVEVIGNRRSLPLTLTLSPKGRGEDNGFSPPPPCPPNNVGGSVLRRKGGEGRGEGGDLIGMGKRCLFLARDLGRAFKPFPVPAGTLACNFHSLHLVEGCDLECSYCILQAYLTNPLLTVYVNTEEILQNLEDFLKVRPDETFRIGTGQLADSLSLDPLTAHTEELVPFFARQKNAVLELKTKSVNIARLEKLTHGGRTIVSWSMNTPRIQREEEHRCASIEERICAAGQCAAWGYRVGFHFDPLIDYAGCEAEYDKTIEAIFSRVPCESVAWVSFGSFRFMPKLKKIMEGRFPKSPLPYAEWTRGPDGKMRYYKERRIELYSRLVKFLSGLRPEVPVYLCMETEEVWRRVFGEAPDERKIASRLNESALVCTRPILKTGV